VRGGTNCRRYLLCGEEKSKTHLLLKVEGGVHEHQVAKYEQGNITQKVTDW
jgi:hypothetical protein